MNRLLVAAVVLLVALGTLLGSSGTSSADSPVGKIYYVEAGAILRSNLDGSAEEEIVPAGHSPGDLAIDKTGAFIYWTNAPAGKIQRADLDGGSIVDVVTGISGLFRITLDGAGKIYWNAPSGSLTEIGTIWRADVDGSNIESVYTFHGLRSVAVDPIDGYIYSALLNTIIRSPIDGSSIDLFEDALGKASAFAVNDLALAQSTGEVYYAGWTVGGPPSFPSFAGTTGKLGDWSHSIEGPFFRYIALDIEHGHVYWTGQQLFRANLDGTNIFAVFGAGCCSGGIALGPCPAGESCPPPPAGPTTPTPTTMPTPNPVGGVALGQSLAPLRDDSEPARTLWLTMLGAIAVALSGSAWYAHKRWTRR